MCETIIVGREQSRSGGARSGGQQNPEVFRSLALALALALLNGTNTYTLDERSDRDHEHPPT
jgi:hypothetical protein